MSQENAEVVRQALDAFNRRDKAAWLALCDPEVENVPPRDWPETDLLRGPGAVWGFYVEAQEAWDASSYEYVELIDAGNDKIVTQQRGDVRGKASGAGVVFSYWQVVTLRNGKALRIEWFTDRAQALEAAGLSE
jgi:ketosteroid isomerase-like protein